MKNGTKRTTNKKTFSNNQLKGNWGEQYIASKLTAVGCLVRHVPQGHDSGIDLYCESIRNGVPFLHFFVQVKTSNKYKTNVKECKFSEQNVEKIRYWIKQPVPVFIILVPDCREEVYTPFYICSALDFDDGNRKTITSRIKINNKKKLEKLFLGENDNSKALLIKETFEWNLSKGHLAPLQMVEKSSLRWFPEKIMNTKPKLKKVSNTLHDSLWRISEDLLGEIYEFSKLRFKGKLSRDLLRVEPYMKALEAILETNKASNVSRITLGLWYAAKDNYSTAQEWIKRGIKIVKKNISNTSDVSTKNHLKKQLEESEKYLKLITDRVKNN